jgi:bifunctional DNase/RNase
MLAARSAMTRRLLPLLLLLGVAACGEGAGNAPGTVAVRVAGVALDEVADSPVVILEELEGGRRLPIWIGLSEAHSIAAKLAAETPPRPNSHDLAQRLIEGLEGRVERVVVTALRDGIYYARIDLVHAGRTLEIDARPSDAIAIALRLSAPLFVASALLETPGPASPPSEREVRHPASERQESAREL